MLLSTMYHHINSDQFSNDLETFEQHLQYVIDRFNIVVPGDPLSKKKKISASLLMMPIMISTTTSFLC